MDLDSSAALHIKQLSLGSPRWVQCESDSQAAASGLRVSDGWDVERGKGQQVVHCHLYSVKQC